jgi:hypothetical protein
MSKIVLNVAQRNMLRAVFIIISGVDDINTDAVLEIAEITEALELESAEKTVSELEREIQTRLMRAQRDLRNTGLQIDAINERNEIVPTELYAEYDEHQSIVDGLPSGLSYKLLMDTESVEYDLDKSSINWLVGVMADYTWNQILNRDQQGTVTSSRKTLAPDEAVAAASLVRAIKSASL